MTPPCYTTSWDLTHVGSLATLAECLGYFPRNGPDPVPIEYGDAALEDGCLPRTPRPQTPAAAQEPALCSTGGAPIPRCTDVF